MDFRTACAAALWRNRVSDDSLTENCRFSAVNRWYVYFDKNFRTERVIELTVERDVFSPSKQPRNVVAYAKSVTERYARRDENKKKKKPTKNGRAKRLIFFYILITPYNTHAYYYYFFVRCAVGRAHL